jgi:hypothetical protein
MVAEQQQAKPSAPLIPLVCTRCIPEAMRAYMHFVLWHFELDEEAEDPDKMWRKVPLQINSYRASSTSPGTWASYAAAVEAYERTAEKNPRSGGFRLCACQDC